MSTNLEPLSIRILHLEDEPKDSELVKYTLKSDGIDSTITRVEDREGFEEALASGQYDLILSDYSLPRFDGPSALDLARKRSPDVPFIFVSGRIGEDLAVESLNQGAVDYVLKRFMSRLTPAVERAIKVTRDRKEKALAEWKLRSTEAKLAVLIETSKDWIWSLDGDRRLMTFNSAAAEMFQEEMGVTLRLGMPIEEALRDDALEWWKGWIDQALSGEPLQTERSSYRTGTERQFEISVNPIRSDNAIIGVAVFSRDVSERKRVEREILDQRDELERVNACLLENQSQLIQSGKLASLGQLAAGVAHEINNPMAFVTSNLRTLAKYVQTIKTVMEGVGGFPDALRNNPDPSVKAEVERLEALFKENRIGRVLGDIGEVISESIDGAVRVNEIVQSLKSIARSDEDRPEPTDIHACLEDALRLAWNELKHKCEIRKEYGTIPSIQGRPGHLKQVFLNLLVNSAQAIPERGVISLRTSTSGEYIVIEIEDTGTGISEENLAKLFTPFFTTKPVGEGTGLGLSISHGIIAKLHGEMKVKSEPGKGALFTITLPAEAHLDPESGENEGD